MKKEKIRYYFSWIANLGVVPLFLFIFFLLAPVALPFLFLRVSVACVFDTIKELLQTMTNYFSKKLILTSIQLSLKVVKNILYLFPMLYVTTNLASEYDTQHPLDIHLGIKGHTELKVLELKNYSISDKQVISAKYRPHKNILTIYGTKSGSSELIIWDKSGKKEVYFVYVTSKDGNKALIQLSNTLNQLSIKNELRGEIIAINDEIGSLNKYKILHSLIKKNPDAFMLNGKLSQKLRNQIIGEVYYLSFSEHIDSIKCLEESLQILCSYSASMPLSEKTIKHLEQLYFINFSPVQDDARNKNFILKLKLIQIEKLNGEVINLGLDNLSGNLGELFTIGIKGIIGRNTLELSKEQIDLSALAEPEMSIVFGRPLTIEIGSEIPYRAKTKSGESAQVEWKFAGLKINIDIKALDDKIDATFYTEFTRPEVNGSISGSKEKSTIILGANTAVKAFEIGFKTTGHLKSNLPYLHNIPILGRLFESNSNQENYKKIVGIILIEDTNINR